MSWEDREMFFIGQHVAKLHKILLGGYCPHPRFSLLISASLYHPLVFNGLCGLHFCSGSQLGPHLG